MHEPDIWWMFRTGEWILDNNQVVTHDNFSYTFQGTPWVNVKWLFEVIVVKLAKWFGPEFTFILQTIVNLAFVWLIYRITRSFRTSIGENITRLPTLGLVAATYLALFGTEFRMIGRPEMVSHLFLMLYLFVFAYYRNHHSIWIYVLVALQVLWTNLHEAFGTGYVIMGTMLGSYWFEYLFFQKKDEAKKPVHLTIATVLAVLATAINPNGFKMILHPYEIFTQVGDNKFTTELFNFTTTYYWQQKEPYLLLVSFVMGIIGFLSIAKRPRTIGNIIAPLGLGYFLLFLMFFYLALTAHRNIVFFMLLSAPLIAVTIELFSVVFWKKIPLTVGTVQVSAFIVLILFGLAAYIAIASNVYYEYVNIHERFGLQVSSEKNPVGAAEYVKQKNIKGRAYSDYLTSSYLLWELRPDFKTYVDLRDLDVFPAEFITQANQELFYPEIWEAANKKYGFDYVVLYRPVGNNLHRYLYQHPDWLLTFADPVAAVYVRRNLQNLKTPARDVFMPPLYRKPSDAATAVSKLFWPMYTPEKAEVNTDQLAVQFYKTVGNMDLALARAQKLLNIPGQKYEGLVLSGELYLQLARQEQTPAAKVPALAKASDYFTQAVNEFPKKPGGFEGLGNYYLQTGNLQQAETYLAKAIELDQHPDVELLTTMAECQRMLMEVNPQYEQFYFDKWLEYSLMAYETDPENQQIKFTIGLAYCNRNDCENAKKFLEDVTGYPGISQEELQLAAQCRQRCGIE
ncbi:MAG: hypothetical protein LPK19_15950 [Hymenobacteraceae bacterium]|nr:hypothetical protein [Hymenobacteraceae bacterium]MDX5397730.1 hypothetical protein [Hymenobacteraceae bacterium]MDX5513808.1 hypothetical protein [Hymenobacteraceae bacterium]